MSLRRRRRWWWLGAALLAALLALVAFADLEVPDPQRVIREVGARLGAWTYPLVAALAFLESAAFVGLLAPGEFAVVFGGFVAGQGRIELAVLVPVVWAAAFLGDVAGYWLGRRFGRGWILRHGPRLRVTRSRLEWAERYFDAHGGKTIIVGRFVGIVRALAPFLAGSSRMPFGRFAAVDLVGAGAWAATFSALGYVFWQSLDRALDVAQRGKLGLVLVLALVLAAVLGYRFLRVPENRRRLRARVGGRLSAPTIERMRTTAELREGFLSFFESKGHTRLPSWPLVPRADDRSTLLTSAGMQPQMPFFLGREQPPAPLTTTAQKCFRTPDIDDVGLDGHHLTFFEMLGNFSFGQYFKEGAIELAWEFLNEHLRIDLDRFHVTVFAGDPELGLGEDEVAAAHWAKIGVPPERISRLGRAHNFWSVGGPGPCGPDTEMFYDRGEGVGCGRPTCAPGCECERFLEFWNLVFMEYELHADGTLTPLPTQNVDTGMGLERTASILQDVISVYETDGYQAIMDWIAAESGVAFGDSEQATKAHRVLADHGRGMTFLTADGVIPSNEGRGYVLRRIIRRAVQQARTIGLDDLWRMTDVVIEQMADWYPELRENRDRVQELVRAEEERFSETLARGMRLFEEVAAGDAISGEQAFELQATYGFPVELTVELARERGKVVDVEGFERAMEQHREISRAGGERGDVRAAEFARAAGFRTEFVGWEKTDVLTQIGALEELGDGTFLAKLRESPFYPEGGGQVTDAGVLVHEGSGASADLVAAYRFEEDQALLFHGEGFAAGDRVHAVVSWPVRAPTMANHTATHLLHAALRETLGDHVRQAGSAVRPDKLRFDFTHGQALTPEERDAIERRVNEQVFANLPVRAFVTPLEEARKLGAMMLFGEKYGDDVRVVEIRGISRELCGGTHVRSTAEIGPFVIVSESSVGAGARRIEALTAGEAYAWLHGRAREADELRAELERARKESKRKPAAAAETDIVFVREDEAGGVNVVIAEVKAAGMTELLEISDRLKQQRKPAAVFLGAADDGTVHLVANFDATLEERLDAVEVVRAAAAHVGGGGGGRRTMARAGGRQPDKLPAALATAAERIVDGLT